MTTEEDKYSKYALYGVVSGLIVGFILGVLGILLVFSVNIEDMVASILDVQLRKLNITQEEYTKIREEALSQVKSILHIVIWLSPIVSMIQYVILGALFGLFYGFIRIKIRASVLIAGLLTSLAHILLLGVIPLVITMVSYPEIMGIIRKYFNDALIIASIVLPGILYTIILVVFSTRGILARLVEAKPRIT